MLKASAMKLMPKSAMKKVKGLEMGPGTVTKRKTAMTMKEKAAMKMKKASAMKKKPGERKNVKNLPKTKPHGPGRKAPKKGERINLRGYDFFR
jgi:hypothetical protein